MSGTETGEIRILHTADWHLGREFHGLGLDAVHQAFFDWLAAEIEAREIDLLIMAGDVFDRALPPLSAVEMLNRELARLADLCEVVMITGNHDSTVRMSHGPLMRPGIHLRSGTTDLGIPVLPDDLDLPLAVYPVPYLDPGSAADALGVEPARHEPVLRAAVDLCREDLAGRPGTRSIAVGHAFVQGGEESDSERSISIGGSDRVPANVFEGFDYVALGHLHRPQSHANTRYSGSPIPLSFSEVGLGEKSVTMIRLRADGDAEIEPVPVPQPVTMARLSGSLEELLEDGELEPLRDAWIEVTLTDRPRPDQPMERLRSRFANVVSLRFESPISTADEESARRLTEIAETDPGDLVASFVEHVRGTGPDPDEIELIGRALDSRTAEETR